MSLIGQKCISLHPQSQQSFIVLISKNTTSVTKLQVASCAQNPSHSYCRADFYQKRNPQPLVVHPFFLLYMCNPVGGFFFLFIQYIDILGHEQIQSKKHIRIKVAGCVLEQNLVHSILQGRFRAQPATCNSATFVFRHLSVNAFTFHTNRLRVFRPTKMSTGCIQTRPIIVKDKETTTSLQL